MIGRGIVIHKVWINPYGLWEVGVEITHMHYMNQRETKDNKKDRGNHLNSSIVSYVFVYVQKPNEAQQILFIECIKNGV